MATAAKITYDDYVALPDDGNRYEVIEGELCLVPAPNLKHQTIVLNIAVEFRNFLRKHAIGNVYISPFDVVLSKTNVLQPDMLYVAKNRLNILTKAGARGAPNLAVEVLSNSTRRRDRVTKLRLYDDFGVDEYWIVDPGRETVRVHRRDEEEKLTFISEISDGVLETPLLPGLVIPIASIFED